MLPLLRSPYGRYWEVEDELKEQHTPWACPAIRLLCELVRSAEHVRTCVDTRKCLEELELRSNRLVHDLGEAGRGGERGLQKHGDARVQEARDGAAG
jgi:hypothetical protein